MISYDKAEIKEMLELDQIFDIIHEFGGDPEYTNFGIISTTICHNRPGEGSKKLYFYENSGLFRCYTGCDSTFDIFELVQKVADIQWGKNYDLNDAVRWIAYRFGFSGNYLEDENEKLDDWKIIDRYEKNIKIDKEKQIVTLNEYDDIILSRFNYSLKLTPWLNEGISQKAIEHNNIGFYPGGDQITIPHYDQNGRFIGLRGRTLCKEEAEKYGKYRPLKINGILYNHPLGFNLYNLNNSKDNIKIIEKAIVFESEKSTLQYQSHFGIENDISVACCGSSVSLYQINLLIEAGAKEIIIAFDRQFQKPHDDEYERLIKKFYKMNEKYKNFVTISFIFDKNMITSYKASPIDEGPEKFLQLFKERVVI